MALNYTPGMEDELNSNVGTSRYKPTWQGGYAIPTPDKKPNFSYVTPNGAAGSSGRATSAIEFFIPSTGGSNDPTADPTAPWWKQQGIGDWGKKSSSSGGSSYSRYPSSYSRGGGSMTTSYADYPTIAMPTLDPIGYPTLKTADLPTYTSPERDERRIRALQAKAKRVPTERIREGLEIAQLDARNEDNPALRKFYTDAALSGYGAGLGDVSRAGDIAGLSEYEQEFAPKLEASRLNFSTEVQRAINDANIANQAAIGAYGQQISDRNRQFDLMAGVYGQQPLSRQAAGIPSATPGINPSRTAFYTNPLTGRTSYV